MTHDDVSSELLRETILRLAAARGFGKTICPSEVARSIQPENWRPLMPSVREAAAVLQGAGAIVVTQSGQHADPLTVRGPIRIGIAESSE